MAFMGGVFGGNTTGADSATQANQMLQFGAKQGNAALRQGAATAKGEFGTNYYDPYTAGMSDVMALRRKALGAEGPQGNADAMAAFQTAPGYQFAFDQGIQGLDRSAAGKGLFGSGNAAMALSDYGQGMANQEFGNWLTRLSELSSQGLQAAGGQTARQGALAGIDTGLGQGLSNNFTGTTQAGANAFTQGNQADAQSNQQGTANFISALLGGLNLATKPFTPAPTFKLS